MLNLERKIKKLDIEIRLAKRSDAYLYASNARKEDFIECMAAFLMKPLEAAKFSIQNSSVAYSAFVNKKLVCIYGMVRGSALSPGIGTIWLLSTKEVDKYTYRFIKALSPEIDRVSVGYDMVENWVDVRNRGMIQALKFLGFTLNEPEQYGVLRRLAHRFWRAKQCA